MKETLSPPERIRKKKDFLFLYKEGNRYRGKYFNFIYIPNDLSFSRMAVIVNKRVGNAVRRNKIKRRMRTLFRRNKTLLQGSLDIIVVAKKEILKMSWPLLQEEYLAAIQSISQNKQSR